MGGSGSEITLAVCGTNELRMSVALVVRLIALQRHLQVGRITLGARHGFVRVCKWWSPDLYCGG